jgi:glycosyltransferase involved in cell wall biosynthesis
MDILIFNWRDIENPNAGGAEVVLHETAKRLAKNNNVTLLTSGFSNCKNQITIDGIDIFRVGNRFSVYYESYKLYKNKFKGKVDIVVDSVNTIPFWTPKYVVEPVVPFIFQMTKDVYYEVFPYPLAFMAAHLEPLLFHPYKKCNTIVMSESIRDELGENGFVKESLHVVEPGIDHEKGLGPGPKTDYPTIIYMNRIVKYKRPDHAVVAFAAIRDKVPDARLIICGFRNTNPFEDYVKKMISDLDLSNSVDLMGFVRGNEKLELLRSSWVHILPSIREGWGLSISEASACGTPTIGYNTVGVKDSVKDGCTGLLAPIGKIDMLASNIIELLKDDARRKHMSETCVNDSSRLVWDRSARLFEDVLKSVLRKSE